MATFSIDAPLEALELNYLAEHIGPFDWRKLGLHLGIPEPRLANWERQYMMNTEQASNQMLFTWHNNQRPTEERRLLVQALENCRLRNLGDKIKLGQCRGGIPAGMNPITNYQNPAPQPPVQQTAFVNHEAPYQTAQVHPPAATEATASLTLSSHEISEIMLRDLAQKLGAEWRALGTYLGFDNSAIEVLSEQYPVLKERIFQMLLGWRSVKGEKATKQELNKALVKAERADLNELIDNPDNE